MREEDQNQPATKGQTGDTSQQRDEPTGAQKRDEPSLTQPATDNAQTKEDERTGEGTGSRAGEYS